MREHACKVISDNSYEWSEIGLNNLDGRRLYLFLYQFGCDILIGFGWYTYICMYLLCAYRIWLTYIAVYLRVFNKGIEDLNVRWIKA